jgi:CRP/FNR family cyclic AMP-dependent transcriptional regulator
MSQSTETPHAPLPPIGIFKVLTDEHRDILTRLGKFRILAPGAALIEQGDHGDSLFFVLEGVLNVTCHSPMSTVSMGTIKAGETVGEMNIIDPLKASATVKVQHTARVWQISRDNLEQFFKEYPACGVAILKEIAVLLTRRIRRGADRAIRQAELAVAIYELD